MNDIPKPTLPKTEQFIREMIIDHKSMAIAIIREAKERLKKQKNEENIAFLLNILLALSNAFLKDTHNIDIDLHAYLYEDSKEHSDFFKEEEEK